MILFQIHGLLSIQMIGYLIINSALIFGVWKLCEPGMLLGTPAGWLRMKCGFLNQRKDRTYLLKPLFDCPPCMASVHGSWFYYYQYQTIDAQMVVYLIALVGINTLLSNTFKRM